MPGDFDLVKERVDIVQVIGEHVPLKRAGRIFKALCPFHSEKTPSFTVDPERRTYKCFGCGEGGDVFTFLEKKEGLSPAEALERLAERAGVELTRVRREERDEDRRLLEAHEAAYFYFRQALRGTPGGKVAGAYLARRGISPETIEKFGLGYAPDLTEGLLTYLRKKGFSDDEALRSGLVLRTERGSLLDRFRHRVMVPIRDGKGRPIAFAGRTLRAEERAKYVNSPTTPLFEKSRVLFALDLGKPAIRKSREAIVVEGQFDAIAAHQAGVANVVASMGTALTAQQYEVLRPLADRAVIAFDADPAGVKAAETRGKDLLALADRVLLRAGRGTLATAVGLDLFVAVLPPGTDPDELVRSDVERFRRVVAEAKPVVEFLLDLQATRHDLASPTGRRAYVREAVGLLALVADPITRAVYTDRLTGRTGVSTEELTAQIRRVAAGTPGAAAEVAGGKQRATPERYVVAQLLRFPDRIDQIGLSIEDFSDADLRAIFGLLAKRQPVERFPEALRDRAAALAAEVDEPASFDDLVMAVEQAALLVRERSLLRRMEEAHEAVARGETAEVDRLTGLLREIREARERRSSLERPGGDEHD